MFQIKCISESLCECVSPYFNQSAFNQGSRVPIISKIYLFISQMWGNLGRCSSERGSQRLMELLTRHSETLLWVLSMACSQSGISPVASMQLPLGSHSQHLVASLESLLASSQDRKLGVEEESKNKWGSTLSHVTVYPCF